MNIIVIGNGLSAINFIDAFRKEDAESSITTFSDETYYPYNRTRIPDCISGEKKIEDIYLKPLKWYEDNKVSHNLGYIVDKIDREAKKVFAYKKGESKDSGKWYPYDKLILATGSRPRRFSYENDKVAGMFDVRTYEDVLNIQKYIKENNCKHASVIGGGLLGLELANSLKKLNIQVTVIEIFNYLLPRQLDEPGGQVLQGYLEKLGLDFVLGAKVKSILGDKKVTGLAFADGRTIETDIVFQQVGIIPNIELAKNSGIKTDKGIIVDDCMRTSDENILAIGDCAEHNGRIYGIIPACMDQAKCAAKVLVGKPEAYTGTVPKTMLKIAGISMMSIGNIKEDEIPNLYEYFYEDSDQNLYRKGLVSGNVLVGAILLGKFNMAYFNKNMNKEISIEELKEQIDAD